MKQAFLLLPILAFALLWTSCEHEIPYKTGNQEPQLVMNALLETDKAENFVYLDISHTHYTTPVTSGVVTLYLNGQLAETAEAVPRYDNGYIHDPQSGSTPSRYRLTSRLHPGDVVRLEAMAEGGKYYATAEVTVPQPLQEIQVDTCLRVIKNHGSYNTHRQFNVTLHDPAGQADYYRLSIQYENTLRGTNLEGRDSTACICTEAELINREDVILTDGRPSSTDSEDSENGDIFGNYIENKYNVFSDSRFAGNSCTLKVYSPLHEYNAGYGFIGSFTLSSTIRVRLLKLNETGYRYLRILNTLEDTDYDETLMEPVVIPSNVTGGLGMVNVCSATVASIKLPDIVHNSIYQLIPDSNSTIIKTPYITFL